MSNFIKPVKRFQMKSNGCRDVQHTGLQSTQTRRNTGKQGAQTRGTRSAHLPISIQLHQWLHCICLTTKQFFFVTFAHLNILLLPMSAKKMIAYPTICSNNVCKSIRGYKKKIDICSGATDVGMLGKMCRSSAPCLCTLLTSVPSCLCAL